MTSLAARCALLAPALVLALVAADSAFAQAAQVTTDVGPHYVGEPVAIRVTAVGFEEEPTPEIQVPPTHDGRLELVGVSPSVSQSITIVNGHMSRTREVTHVFQFRFVAARSGNVSLGPFEIHQAARSASVAAVRLSIQQMPTNEDVRVELKLPEGELFVGERVPVTVSFSLERSLQKNLLGYTLRVPLFEEESSFRFLDDEDATGDTDVVVQTADGNLQLRGSTQETTRGDKRYTTVSVTRTMVPLAPGHHSIPGAWLSVEEGTRFRRDFFGGRRATQVRRWRAEDGARVVEVAAIPGQAQPPSFGGAIGRGFSLEVSADRTVIQVGDPVTLTLVLRGDGLETASLPPLDAEGLLPPDRFRVPEGRPTGEIEGDSKRFTVVVRVLDDSVSEIPALAYSWFDPDTRQYETTHSRPIALSARPAEVIGAGDVQVRAASEAPAEASSAPAAASPTAPLALAGVDLAIERDPDRVLGSRMGFGGAWLAPLLYLGSLGLVTGAWLDRRRRRVDPVRVRRRRLIDEQLERLREAPGLAPGDGAAEVARAIRNVLRELPEASTPDIDAVLGECDARSYAPPGAQVALDEIRIGRVRDWLERLRGEVR